MAGLNTLISRSRRMGHPFVVVSDEMKAAEGIPSDEHPCNWIRIPDDGPPACGEPERLTSVAAEVWCLRPEGHVGDHW